MLLTITTTHKPATDIGFLLHKNPANLHKISLSFGDAYIFYPEVSEEKCTAALLLDIDPVKLTRKENANDKFALKPYVNDRPYVASSFMSVAMGNAFGTLFSGKSKHKPELIEQSIPLEIKISVLPCSGGVDLLHKLFDPLGYELKAERIMLDNKFIQSETNYFSVIFSKLCPLREFLMHLYVLIPVLDNEKHYWVGEDEIEKLLRYGDTWLKSHPEQKLILKRYLKNKGTLVKQAINRLTEDEVQLDDNEQLSKQTEEILETKINLNQLRLEWMATKLKELDAKKVIDLGCGEGKLLRILLQDNFFEQISGCDVSMRSLEMAKARLNLDYLPTWQQNRIKLFQTALTYSDKRLSGYNAATLVEVIEHLDLPRLEALKRVVFEFANPQIVIISTPNIEYNQLFVDLPAGQLRHSDHRFEWTRSEFQNWAHDVAKQFGYKVSFEAIGEFHETLGAPTQVGIFTKND